MRNDSSKIPKTIPRTTAVIIFKLTGLDVTLTQSIKFFYELELDIYLKIAVETQNRNEGEPVEHELKSFEFGIQEANATAEDPDSPGFELAILVGFDSIRLTILADELKVISNEICAETPSNSRIEAGQSQYEGWFKMRLIGPDPLSWRFIPRKGDRVLKNRIVAERLARIRTADGAAVVAELTARRDALKVRRAEEKDPSSSTKLSEMHRDKMCAALVRRSMMGSAAEYVLFRTPLVSA